MAFKAPKKDEKQNIVFMFGNILYRDPEGIYWIEEKK